MTDFRQVWRLHAYSGGTVRDSHPVFYSPVGLLPHPQALKRNIYLTIEYHFELILSRGKGCAAQSDNVLYTMLLKKVKKIFDKSPASPVDCRSIPARRDRHHNFSSPKGRKMQIESVTRTFGVGNIYSVKQAQEMGITFW